jgi:hypothetical protein
MKNGHFGVRIIQSRETGRLAEERLTTTAQLEWRAWSRSRGMDGEKTGLYLTMWKIAGSF